MRSAILAVLVCSLTGCVDGDPPIQDPLPLTRLQTDRTYLRDGHERYVGINGINVSCSTKVPTAIDEFGIPTYVAKPFPEEDADLHFARLRDWGFNAIRLLIVWEGIEPTGPGEYDQEYIQYIRRIVEKANDYGIYVLVDMHQDMFSRHLKVDYNAVTPARYGAPGSLGAQMLALVEPFEPYFDQANRDEVKGDGAPRWAVEACLPEKELDSPNWGTPRILSGLEDITPILDLIAELSGSQTTELEDWMGIFLAGLPEPFPVNETTDVLPFTHWGIAHALSVDVARSYACFFAGDVAFPGLKYRGQDVNVALQDSYAAAFAQVAAQVADLPNVIGYDLMNEPSANFILLAAVAAIKQSGLIESAEGTLINLLGDEIGPLVYETVLTLRLLPPDANPDTLREWGLDYVDLMGVLGLNYGFDDNHLRPFYEKVGAAILAQDPNAVFFIESTISLSSILGGPQGGIAGQWENPMTAPVGLDQLVFAPHFYPDIYPPLGFNQPPREFSPEEVRYRDYTEGLEEAMFLASYSLGNVPVVFGEFGTYFDFNGLVAAEREEHLVSQHVLDNYYENFEALGVGRMLWCYSPENDPVTADLWNRENFSIFDYHQEPRGEAAWARPFARALAGKPIASRFFSDRHYFDPDKGIAVPVREYELIYASKESSAPTEISVPRLQYPDGFYVWVSDGFCHFDPATSILYHYPSRDEPGVEHRVRLLPPLAGEENIGWKYFFSGDEMVDGNG